MGSDRHDHVHGLGREAVEDRPEQLGAAVELRPHRHVDERAGPRLVEPGGQHGVGRVVEGVRPDELDVRDLGDLGALERRRADVEVPLAAEAADAGVGDAEPAADGIDGFGADLAQLPRAEHAERVLRVRDARRPRRRSPPAISAVSWMSRSGRQSRRIGSRSASIGSIRTRRRCRARCAAPGPMARPPASSAPRDTAGASPRACRDRRGRRRTRRRGRAGRRRDRSRTATSWPAARNARARGAIGLKCPRPTTQVNRTRISRGVGRRRRGGRPTIASSGGRSRGRGRRGTRAARSPPSRAPPRPRRGAGGTPSPR